MIKNLPALYTFDCFARGSENENLPSFKDAIAQVHYNCESRQQAEELANAAFMEKFGYAPQNIWVHVLECTRYPVKADTRWNRLIARLRWKWQNRASRYVKPVNRGGTIDPTETGQ